MNTQINVLERIKQDHDRHRELLDKISQTQGDSEERRELFTEHLASGIEGVAARIGDDHVIHLRAIAQGLVISAEMGAAGLGDDADGDGVFGIGHGGE